MSAAPGQRSGGHRAAQPFLLGQSQGDVHAHRRLGFGRTSWPPRVGKVYETLKSTSGGKGEVAKADLDPAQTTLDPKKIDAVLGVKGALAKGVYKATIGRTTQMMGHEMGNQMGVNTWAAFVGSDDKAAVMGDFAMYEPELLNVLKALRGHNISIVAIHNHYDRRNPARDVPALLGDWLDDGSGNGIEGGVGYAEVTDASVQLIAQAGRPGIDCQV